MEQDKRKITLNEKGEKKLQYTQYLKRHSKNWNTQLKQASSLSRRLMYQYITSLLVFVVIICIAAFFGWAFCNSRTWYGTESMYRVLVWVKHNMLLVLTVISLIGAIGIACLFLLAPLRYLDAVILAAGKLAHPTDEVIELPEAIHDVEDKLNLAREQALRNAALAREAEQRKNDLIVYLAHDLKTPLTSVIGYLTLLRDEPQISESLQMRYTNIALDKAERLEDLINEFFDITRFNLTTLSLEPERINLSRMLEQVVNEFLPVLAEKQLTWKTQIEPNVELLCDPDKLQRVFDNLIRNAISYSYAGTEIMLVMEMSSQQAVEICVKNHGKTIPAEKLAHIFEQFYRVDSSRASATGGAGLGLAIAREIIELHGGMIRAESKNESITFFVHLPLQKVVVAS